MSELSKIEIGWAAPVYYRDGTSDAAVIQANFCDKPEYILPPIEPKCIFDIGGNIGVLAVIMANVYPKAMIYTFEPVQDNYEILVKNTSPYPNIKALNIGLGSKSGERAIFQSDDERNFGGYSLQCVGVDVLKDQSVWVSDINQVIADLGVRVDLIKIDTEGSEHEILTSITPENMASVQCILGELHGTRDYEVLGHLEKDFSLSFMKPMDSRMFTFYAKRLSKNS